MTRPIAYICVCVYMYVGFVKLVQDVKPRSSQSFIYSWRKADCLNPIDDPLCHQKVCDFLLSLFD